MEKAQLVGVGENRAVKKTEFLKGRADLVDVLADEMLGADAGAAVQRGVANIAQVPVQALSKMVDQLCNVALVAILANLAQTAADQAPVIIIRRFVLLPFFQSAVTIQKLGRLRQLW